MNNNIIDFLTKEIDEKKISHAFLVETNNCENLLNDIVNVLMEHNILPKLNIENNISISIIRPENNLIDKNKILDLQKFIMTKSIVNDYKIYFIINAELMNLSSNNKLLKVLEEPAENVIGFLLTENSNAITSTIKSRCKRFKNDYNQIETKAIDRDAFEMLKRIKELKFDEIIEFKKILLSKDKIEITYILEKYRIYISNQLQESNNIKTLANLYKILDNIIELIKSNVNVELCLDKMLIEMRR